MGLDKETLPARPQSSEKVDSEHRACVAASFCGSDAAFGISCRTEAGADARMLPVT